MERSTDKSNQHTHFTHLTDVGGLSCPDICEDAYGDCGNCIIEKAFRKLRDIEDADESGLLLRLPCKIGTECWLLHKNPDWNSHVPYYQKDISPELRTPKHNISVTKFQIEDVNRVGTELFLTREEAEAALKRLEV